MSTEKIIFTPIYTQMFPHSLPIVSLEFKVIVKLAHPPRINNHLDDNNSSVLDAIAAMVVNAFY